MSLDLCVGLETCSLFTQQCWRLPTLLRQRITKLGLHQPVAGRLARNQRAPCPDSQGLSLLGSRASVPFRSVKMDLSAARGDTSVIIF